MTINEFFAKSMEADRTNKKSFIYNGHRYVRKFAETGVTYYAKAGAVPRGPANNPARKRTTEGGETCASGERYINCKTKNNKGQCPCAPKRALKKP